MYQYLNGCASIFNANYCLSILAQIFYDEKSISKLKKFLSINRANHYNLKTNKEKIRLIKSTEALMFKKMLSINNQNINIFYPGFPVFWKVLAL